MSDTNSEYNDDTSSEGSVYEVKTWDEMEKAKNTVITNSYCNCGKCVFCDECAKTNVKLKLCFRTLPIEVLNNISGFIRCKVCEEMMNTLNNKDLDEIDDLFELKIFYFTEFNVFPSYETTLKIPKVENHDPAKHKELEFLYHALYEDEEIIYWKEAFFTDCYNAEKDIETALDELNDMFKTFREIMYYMNDNDDYRHEILYGGLFVLDILDRVNDIFFGVDSDEED